MLGNKENVGDVYDYIRVLLNVIIGRQVFNYSVVWFRSNGPNSKNT